MIKKRYQFVMWGCLAAILLAATFLDLQISQIVYNGASVFAKILEIGGEMIAVLIVAFCCALVILARPTDVKWKSIVLLIGFGVAFALSVLFAAYLLIDAIGISIYFSIIIAAALAIGVFLLTKLVDKSKKSEIIKVAFIGILLFFVTVVIITALKYIWNRLRFANMVELQDYTNYSLWFIPQAKGAIVDSDAYTSFPSGHVGIATVVVWLLTLPKIVPRLNNKKVLLNIIIWVWIALVALSRIISGAHFLSDTVVGASIAIGVYILLNKIIKLNSGLEQTTSCQVGE